MPAVICFIGSSNTDMVIEGDKPPAPGETVIGGPFLMNPGGKGANQAVAAARLANVQSGTDPTTPPASVTFVANLGNDVFGRQAARRLHERGMANVVITLGARGAQSSRPHRHPVDALPLLTA